MAQTPDETRREIEETRLRIAEAAEELEERLKSSTDWRALVDEYPLESVIAALVGGFLAGSIVLGALFGGRRRNGAPQAMVMSRGGGGIMSWLRPILIPIITARLVDYFQRQEPVPAKPVEPIVVEPREVKE